MKLPAGPPSDQARQAIGWLAVPFLGYNFVVALGLTHIYTTVPAWALLAGLLVLGFATVGGGATSHVAILARSLDIPAVAGIEPRSIEVDFAGTDMNMGYNRPQLQRGNNGQFTGQATLPVCITGRMAWQAVVVVTNSKAKVAAPFRFITTRE